MLAVAVLLGGCSTGLLGGATRAVAPDQQRIAVGNQLTLPPDLQLKAPTNTADGYQPNSGVGKPAEPSSNYDLASANDDGQISAGTTSGALYGNAGTAPSAPAAKQQDVYAKYGISKFNADGSQKSDAQLKKELKAAMLEEKRRNNPGYGTVRNIGAIFSDN